MLRKCYTQYASKFGKLCSGHRTGKGVFIPIQRRTMPNNVQTTIKLCLFHMLARSCSKSFKLGFNSTWTENFQMYKQDLEKAEEPEIQLSTSLWSLKKQESSRKKEKKTHLFLLYWLCQSLWLCGSHTHKKKLWKIIKDGNTRLPDLPLEKSAYRSRINS